MCCHFAAQLPGGSSCIIMLHQGYSRASTARIAEYRDQSTQGIKRQTQRVAGSSEQSLFPFKGHFGRGVPSHPGRSSIADASSSSPIEVHTCGVVHPIMVPFHVQVWAVFTAIVQELHEGAQASED